MYTSIFMYIFFRLFTCIFYYQLHFILFFILYELIFCILSGSTIDNLITWYAYHAIKRSALWGFLGFFIPILIAVITLASFPLTIDTGQSGWFPRASSKSSFLIYFMLLFDFFDLSFLIFDYFRSLTLIYFRLNQTKKQTNQKKNKKAPLYNLCLYFIV